MRPGLNSSSRAGYTVLEVVIGASVAALILLNVGMVLRSSSGAYESGVFGSNLEGRVDRTLDRISLALMSTNSEGLDEVQMAPSFVSSIDYEVVTDVEEGLPVEGANERIEFRVQDGLIVWTRNPDEADEQSAVWTRWVPELLEGEDANGEDDNGNGIADEEGLAFNKDDDQVVVRLTLERADRDEVEYVRTRRRRVTCRN